MSLVEYRRWGLICLGKLGNGYTLCDVYIVFKCNSSALIFLVDGHVSFVASNFNGCVLFHRSDRSDRSEQKFAVLFHRSDNPIKMHRVLFLRSDLSDRSDYARSKATERLDKPAHLGLTIFLLTGIRVRVTVRKIEK